MKNHLFIAFFILSSTLAFSQKIPVDTIITKAGTRILATTITSSSNNRIRYYPYPKKVAKYMDRSEILRIGNGPGGSSTNTGIDKAGGASNSVPPVWEDVLYLKNESIIRGMIIEQVPNESLKIQTRDGNVFVFKMNEVLKITKEER